MKIHLRHFALFVLLAISALAADLKVGSLNCYLFFDPAIDHRGKVDDANRMTAEQYQTKTANLATLTKGYDFVALQETGGRPEITALASAALVSWAWSQGKPTHPPADRSAPHRARARRGRRKNRRLPRTRTRDPGEWMAHGKDQF